jgi:hypothetical protein
MSDMEAAAQPDRAAAHPDQVAAHPDQAAAHPDQAAAHSAPQAPRPAQAPEPPDPTAEQLALEAGWTMAVLYGRIVPVPPGEAPGLPTANELGQADRRKLESERLEHLLRSLAAVPGFAGAGLPAEGPAPGADEAAWKEELRLLNLDILCALAATRQETRLAYEVGRSLRDTVNLPDQDPATLSRVFDRDRIATIQGWLAELSSELPPETAAVVAASLGRWSEFAMVAVGPPGARLKNGDSTKVAEITGKYLLRQGDLWLMLLTGARSASGLLSPEGYVAAGELALRRSAAIIRGILRHYWPALLVGAAALGAVLYLAITYLGGAAKVWTSIVAIAGSLGITARAVASTITRLSAEAERPVFAAAEEDAMAWAITTMPPLRLGRGQVRQLRKAGIAPTSSLGRI